MLFNYSINRQIDSKGDKPFLGLFDFHSYTNETTHNFYPYSIPNPETDKYGWLLRERDRDGTSLSFPGVVKAASSESVGKFDGGEKRNGQFILSRVRLAIMASFGEVCSLKWP